MCVLLSTSRPRRACVCDVVCVVLWVLCVWLCVRVYVCVFCVFFVCFLCVLCVFCVCVLSVLCVLCVCCVCVLCVCVVCVCVHVHPVVGFVLRRLLLLFCELSIVDHHTLYSAHGESTGRAA